MTPAKAPAYLAAAPVLLRSADVIETEGHIKDEFAAEDGNGYCAAGAIGKCCGIDPADWYGDDEFRPTATRYDDETEYATDYTEWKAGRAASLAALRTLVGHLFPDREPEGMSRVQLLHKVSVWNDADERTPDQVVAEMRAAARQAVSS